MRPGPGSNQTCGASGRFRSARIADTSSALTPCQWCGIWTSRGASITGLCGAGMVCAARQGTGPGDGTGCARGRASLVQPVRHEGGPADEGQAAEDGDRDHQRLGDRGEDGPDNRGGEDAASVTFAVACRVSGVLR
jgi:hypothetical protein